MLVDVVLRPDHVATSFRIVLVHPLAECVVEVFGFAVPFFGDGISHISPIEVSLGFNFRYKHSVTP
ncbi:hypothetical protein D3C86_2103340 [compost metagenome]